jgi:20S proteasome subunit alpha 3
MLTCTRVQYVSYRRYHSDPSGNYFGWKAHCIGANHGAAQGILKQDYKEELTLAEAKALTIKVLYKTLESTALTSEKCKLFHVIDMAYL